MKRPTINELLSKIKNDDKTWDIYSNGITNTINQVEQSGSKKKAEKFFREASVEEINKLLKQFEDMKKMMKMFKNGNMKMPFKF